MGLVLRPLIPSMANLALHSGLWDRRLRMGGSPFQGRYPASQVNDGPCPERPDQLKPRQLFGCATQVRNMLYTKLLPVLAVSHALICFVPLARYGLAGRQHPFHP
jgi:hypothetical protein